MFEYLMPLIFQRSHGNTLLDEAVRAAVAIQMTYGRKRGVPWGTSESAFGDLDLNKTYQYKAFGVPELGLKRGLEEQVVVAPYATLLALNIAPRDRRESETAGCSGASERVRLLRSDRLQPSTQPRGRAWGDRTGVHGPSSRHGFPVAHQFPPWQSDPTPLSCRCTRAGR